MRLISDLPLARSPPSMSWSNLCHRSPSLWIWVRVLLDWASQTNFQSIWLGESHADGSNSSPKGSLKNSCYSIEWDTESLGSDCFSLCASFRSKRLGNFRLTDGLSIISRNKIFSYIDRDRLCVYYVAWCLSYTIESVYNFTVCAMLGLQVKLFKRTQEPQEPGGGLLYLLLKLC